MTFADMFSDPFILIPHIIIGPMPSAPMLVKKSLAPPIGASMSDDAEVDIALAA